MSQGCCTGTATPGLCAGSSDIQCCTNNKCQADVGNGACKQAILCASQGQKSYPGFCSGPSEVQCCVPKTNRADIIKRAQAWVDKKVPYSQTALTDGYRQDCAGYVSMAWASSQPGQVTSNLEKICTRITRSEMQSGDAILLPTTHVLLFDSWVDGDHFKEFAEHGMGQVASHDQTSYSYYEGLGYFPCRFNNL